MPPPQLAAHAPVADVAHPLEVGPCPALGHEACAALVHGGDRRRGERRDLHVPLVGEIGLEYRAAAIPAGNRVAVLLDALDEAGRLELRHDALASLEAVETAEALGHRIGERRLRSEDIDERQLMPLTDLVVVEIVARRDLDDP